MSQSDAYYAACSEAPRHYTSEGLDRAEALEGRMGRIRAYVARIRAALALDAKWPGDTKAMDRVQAYLLAIEKEAK